MRLTVAAIIGGLVVATACPAQVVVGTSVIDGKVVELLSNSTWRFKGATAQACRAIKLSVRFCGEGHGWTATTPASGAVAAMFQHDDANYGEYVVEAVGSDKGVSPDFVRSLVVTTAAESSGQAASDIPVLSDDMAEVGGEHAETVTYFVKMKNVPAIFYNTFVVEPEMTVQIVTFEIGTAPTDAGRRLHGAFVDLTRLK